MTDLSVPILERAAQCFTAARHDLITGAGLLYDIKQRGLWRERYESFSAYLEAECHLSDAAASKFIQVWRFYVVENGMPHESLAATDVEKLYLSLKLPEGTASHRLASARELTRQELKQEVTDPHDTCAHEEKITICASCHRKII